MSDSEQFSNECDTNRTQKCRKKKRSDRQIRERNRNAMRLMRSLKRELENKDSTVQKQPKEKPISNYQLNKNEKNKTAMQIRREYDMEYRMRENQRNKVAMRLRRKVAEYRDRENQRNRDAMQMRRRREKEKSDAEEETSAINFKVEMNTQ